MSPGIVETSTRRGHTISCRLIFLYVLAIHGLVADGRRWK